MEMSTVSSSTPEPQTDSSGAGIAFYTYMYITISSVGIIGNAFVCLVMLRYHKVFNSTTSKLIIHQSFVDFLGSLVFLLRNFLVIHPSTAVPDNFFGSLYCRVWWSYWPQYGMFLTSTNNLVVISLERYLATCQPTRHRHMFSIPRLRMIVAATWLCAWIPEAHVLPITYKIDGACYAFWPSPAVQAVGGVLIFLKDLIIPVLIIVYSYTQIILKLHRRSAARNNDNNQDARKMLSKANKNVTKTMLVVAIFFVICWTPTDINYVLYNLGINSNFVESAMYQIMSSFVVVNLSLNPFIYCFTYQRFQTQAKQMVRGLCGRRLNRVQDTDGTTVSVIDQTDNTTP